VTPIEHREIKGLTKPNQNLRDHMTPLELIFTALGEEMTRRAAISDDAQGFHENKSAAVQGGYTAGEARKRVEEIEGKKVVSNENFLKKNSENDNKELHPSK
jgi:DNA-damage-inducible protein D